MRDSRVLTIVILCLIAFFLGTWILHAILRLVFLVLAFIGLVVVLRMLAGNSSSRRRW